MAINWRNKTIVRFKDGSYRVRRGWLFFRYFDVADSSWWYMHNSSSTRYHEEAVKWLNYKKPKKDWGTPVSIIPPPPGH